jgi:hypothetical protein
VNVLDRLLEKQREHADSLTRLERLVLSSSMAENERLRVAADLYNLHAQIQGREVIPNLDDMSALVRYQVDSFPGPS